MFKLHNWLKQAYIDSADDINLWESIFPLSMFPQTYSFPDVVMWCRAKYNPLQRVVVAQNGDILISIPPNIINKMILIPENDSLRFFFHHGINGPISKAHLPSKSSYFLDLSP